MYNTSSSPTLTDTTVCGNTPDQIDGAYTDNGGNCITEVCEDSDGDETLDCHDGCPNDPNKTEPGDCGCGVPESGDSDGDGTPDCLDNCPDDPNKTEPEMCGCGTAETNVNGDVDCDGVYDIDDIYAGMEHFGIDEAGQCAGDTDGNGVVDIEDLLNMMGSWGACP
jgi:hypothetical protein